MSHKQFSVTRWSGVGRLWLALCVCVVLGGLLTLGPKLLAQADEAPICAQATHVQIGHGESSFRTKWSVRGSLKNNGSCNEWLLGVEFKLGGVSSWGSGVGIPAGGHFANASRLDARELVRGDVMAFSGYVGTAVRELSLKFIDGSRATIVTRAASKGVRMHRRWLRGLAFAVHYFARGVKIDSVSAIDKNGRLLYRVKNEDGEFF